HAARVELHLQGLRAIALLRRRGRARELFEPSLHRPEAGKARLPGTPSGKGLCSWYAMSRRRIAAEPEALRESFALASESKPVPMSLDPDRFQTAWKKILFRRRSDRLSIAAR